MSSKAPCEQSVSVGIMDNIARQRAGTRKAPRHQICPGIKIALGIADDCRLAGRSGRCMNSQKLITRHGEHAEWVVVTEVALQSERKAADVGQRLEIGRTNTCGVEISFCSEKR